MDPFALYPRDRLNDIVVKINIRYRTKSGHHVRNSGTGTIIYNSSRTNTMLVLTCGHVVSVTDELPIYAEPLYSVCFPDAEGRCNDDNLTRPATLLTNSDIHLQEIAVLKVNFSFHNMVPARFRNEPLVQGMPVFTYSNMSPSKHFSHLTGRVGSRCTRAGVFDYDENLIPTFVEFNFDAFDIGASGSGVFDMDGNILAILVSTSILFFPPGRVKSSNEDLLAGYTFKYSTHVVQGIPIAPVLEVLKGLIPDFNLELVSTNTTYLANINPIPCLPSSSRCLDKHSTPNPPTLTPSHSHPFDPLEGFPWADHCKKAVKIKAHTLFYSGRRMISFGSGTIVAKNEGITLVLTCGRIVQTLFNSEVQRVDFEVQFCDNETNRRVEGVSNEALVAHLITDENMMLGEHMALLYVKDPLGRGEIARFRETELVNGMQVIMCANNFENRYSFVTGRVTSRDVKDDEFEFDTPILTYVEYAIATDHHAKGAGLFDLEGNLVAVHVAPCNRTCKVSPPSSDSGARDLMADHKIYYASRVVKGIPIRWISRVLSSLCNRFQLDIEEGQDSANWLLLNLINYLKDKNSSPLISKPNYEKPSPSPSPTQHSKQITSPLPNDPLEAFCWENLGKTAVRITIIRPPSGRSDYILTGTIIFQHNDITLILTCGLHVRAYIDPPEQACTFSIEFSREDGEELCPTPYEATLLSNEEVLRKGIAIFSVKDCCKRKVAQFRKNPPLDGMQLLKCAVFYDCSTFFRTEGRVSSRYVPENGFVEYPVMTRDHGSFGAGLFDIQGDLTAVHVEQVETTCIVDPPISRNSDLGVYRFEIPGRFYRGVPIVLVIEALGYLCRSLGLTIDMTEAAADTMLHGICEYAQSMPTSGGSPFFPPSQPSTEHTRSGKENLCLYGFPSEQWEVPPELPGLALGINFGRDGMQSKDWLALGSVHSDAWLRSVAFYFGARRRLFNMINDFPAIFEAGTGNAKKQVKERSTVSNHSCAKSKSSTKSQHPGMKVKHAKEEEGRLDEEPRDTNASDEFWICCDICETWFHGKCVCEDEAWSLELRKSSSKNALPCLDKQKISDIDIPDFLDVSGPDFTSLFPC